MIFFLIASVFIFAASDALVFNCSTTPFSGTANEMSLESGSLALYFSWKGRVPYFFSNSVTQQDKDFVRKQMDFIESKTCVKFIKQSQFSVPEHHMEIDIDRRSCAEPYYISFNAGVHYGGHLGLKVLFKSNHQFTDQPHCGDNSKDIRGGVIHELFHALGAIHTHQRKDRDNYVTYDERCLGNPGNWHQFNKKEFSMPDSENIPYEFASIMHYECNTMSMCPNGPGCQCNTLQPKDGTSCSEVGSDLPTDLDWKMIRQYQCNGDSGTSSIPAVPTQQPPIPTWPSNNLPTWDWPNLPWFQIPSYFDPHTWYDIPTGPGASFCPYTDIYGICLA